MEVLVALVLTSLLVTILMSSVFYIFKVQDALRREIEEREVALRGQAWFSEVVAGCMPVKKPEDVTRFSGSSEEFACETSRLLAPSKTVRLGAVSFRFAPAGQALTLEYEHRLGDEPVKVIIGTWSASRAFFEYLDHAGVFHDRWPDSAVADEMLPRGVRLTVEERNGGRTVWFAAPQADPWKEEEPNLPPGLDREMFR